MLRDIAELGLLQLAMGLAGWLAGWLDGAFMSMLACDMYWHIYV